VITAPMIIFVHLLNDRSGSPRVLASAIRTLAGIPREARLYVGSDGSGCLDDVGIPIRKYWYRRTSLRLATLFSYAASQLSLFTRLLFARDIPRDAVLYINTLLPFGAAVFGRLTGRRVIYHLHEVSISPAALQKMLLGIARCTADELIYVSDFHRRSLPLGHVPATTVHNALEDDFLRDALTSKYEHERSGVFRVLMLASLRDYKGIPEFVQLARAFANDPAIEFVLVVNDDEDGLARYFGTRDLPSNLRLHPRTANPAEYYAAASLLLNLSRPDQWIETFGLTLIEAMAHGVPVIAPPVGGPVEVVTDGQEGFLVDSRNSQLLQDRVHLLRGDRLLCLRMSQAARERASAFSSAAFSRSLRTVIEATSNKPR